MDVEAKARDSILPKCQTPFDVPQSPSELLGLVITNELRVVPMEFLKAQADEIGVNVEDLVRLDQDLQGMEHDELKLAEKQSKKNYNKFLFLTSFLS